MNRWASGVVSAAKSNLVGMDIRQPRARGTTPLHIQCHGGAQEHGCSVLLLLLLRLAAPGHGHHMCQNTISDQASD